LFKSTFCRRQAADDCRTRSLRSPESNAQRRNKKKAPAGEPAGAQF